MGIDSNELSLGLSEVFVTIKTPIAEVADWLKIRFQHCLGERIRRVGEYSIRESSHGNLGVEGPDGLVAEGVDVAAIGEPLVQHLIERLAAFCSDGLALHSAGISLHGKGLLLAGNSGSGKSTLASACLKRGFDYLSDEVILLAHSPLKMIGFPRPINLKSGSGFIIGEWLKPGTRVDQMWGEIVWIDPGGLGTGVIEQEATPSAIVFPKFVPEAPLRTERLSPAKGLTRLMQLHVNRDQLPDSGFRLAAQLARNLPCWSLEFSRALDGADRLWGVLEAS